MNLSEFLESKPLYYTHIDYERMPRIYKKIKKYFNLSKIIHLVGTNGKGTTGRFLAGALHNLGFNVGHYTSPHILKFNERIWMNANDVSDEILEESHQKLQNLLCQEERNALSYFEYTTFLAMLTFNECEYIILEAGLGGMHDATAVFPKVLTLVTPISYDHESFLGSQIEDIAGEKLGAIQNHAILARQKHKEVYELAKQLKESNSLDIMYVENMILQKDRVKIEEIKKNLSLAGYLKNNLELSIAALNFLKIEYKIESFREALLFGRLSKLGENILVDVGHNPLAAQSVVTSLKGEKYILVYNSYEDKDYTKILNILQPIIDYVEIIEIKDKRIEKLQKLQRVLTDLKIKCHRFTAIQKNQKYLVFGSFKVVEAFLKEYDGQSLYSNDT
ncbi:MAG: bifunctional folylpolyglutamate synthase/dihydrofolate synthase [Sulfurimonas sp.]|nr:bifunctional folylpolyglutamate synthase/dihydrofolate synthase [Sulfurimonas sp.]PHQ92815.1 MAG: bifunctional folylpolyglutamate synthase/dihydrofolate synthase [Sulfurimonas sp.]